MAAPGFMGKISRWFGGASDAYFFGLQIAIKSFGEDTVRAGFARVLEDSRSDSSNVDEKRRLIRRFAALLEESELFWTYGYWEYMDQAESAREEFDTWRDEIEGSIATEDEELHEEVDDLRRTSSRKDYVVVTLAFLLDGPYRAAEAVESDDAAFLKDTFSALVQGLTAVDPRTIQADATYVVPGNEDDGLSEDDLLDPGWNHLRILL